MKKKPKPKEKERRVLSLYLDESLNEKVEKAFADFVNETQMRPSKSEFVATLLRRYLK